MLVTRGRLDKRKAKSQVRSSSANELLKLTLRKGMSGILLMHGFHSIYGVGQSYIQFHLLKVPVGRS